MADRVTIVQGSALELPFPDQSFDRAYSQNVAMNIADKARFYREARRVLKTGGRLVLSNLAQGSGGEAVYPTPWAETAATSFLSTPEVTRAEIEAAGLHITSFRDITAEILSGMKAMRAKLEADGLPPLGPHIFIGDRMRSYQINSLRNSEEGRVLSIEVVCERPV